VHELAVPRCLHRPQAGKSWSHFTFLRRQSKHERTFLFLFRCRPWDLSGVGGDSGASDAERCIILWRFIQEEDGTHEAEVDGLAGARLRRSW
jgi:hypothetical protein